METLYIDCMNIVQSANFTKNILVKQHTRANTKTVLIVERDASLRFLLQSAMQKLHCATICVDSYHDIFAVLEQDQIDLVFIDIITNHWEDFNILQTIRQHFDMPIVVVSAHSPAVAQKWAKQLGATAYLAKPIRLAELFICIRALVFQ